MANRLNLTAIADVAPNDRLVSAWLNLWKSSHEPFPASHPLWTTTQNELFPRQDAFIASFGDSDPLLVTALTVTDDEATFAVNPAISDFNDLCVAPTRLPQIIGDFVQNCFALGIKRLRLTSLASDSPTVTALHAVADSHGWGIAREVEDPAPAINLADDFEHYLSRLPKKDRHESRRKMRRAFNDHKLQRVVHDTPAALKDNLPHFLRLMSLSSQPKKEFLTDSNAAFIKAVALNLAEYGLTKLSFLTVDDRLSAASLYFVVNRTWYTYNSGRDLADNHLSNGIISHLLAIKAACESGVERYDLMRGGETYKYKIGGNLALRELVSIVLER